MIAALLLSKVPVPWRWLALIISWLACFLCGYYKSYEHDATRQKLEMAQVQTHIIKVQAAQQAATVQVVNHYIDRVRIVHEQAQVLQSQVSRYVPVDIPALPGSFRLLHDAAAQGTPLPETPDGTHAAPVAPQDLANTIITNYSACRVNAERLRSLQGWINQISTVTR